ncbi:butyrate kinase [Gallalistipes aquisgranensis]|uniref:butyrate kinase n=1 Tax=Gallalistipes aquisgranensis TaxID=2779358 RepID=UPI001CF8FC5F|nr:butyrate kinase [Gallalistipes aquisgranensis]MBE5033366.1 butyrate kinase [Gallalistipes aquisgranensis]
MKILAINPGSTSTKVALFDNTAPLLELTLRHSAEELSAFKSVMDQFDFRKRLILDALSESRIDIRSLDAVIGRGGLVRPIPSGVYEVNDALERDLRHSPVGEHASNLGGLIAREIAREAGARAFIADPVVVDELQPVARVCGLPGAERISIFHALNQKAIARAYAKKVGRKYEEMNLVVAHLGGGISVGAHRLGEVIDVNNALDGDGPLSPERAGSIPSATLADLCFSGRYTRAEVEKMLCGRGGLVALLGTNDTREAVSRLERGDEKARIAMEAMCYGVAKWIGAMAVVLEGEADAIILTGGIAHSQWVCHRITEQVSFLAPVVVMAGENELEALASNALRVMNGEEEAKVYR